MSEHTPRLEHDFLSGFPDEVLELVGRAGEPVTFAAGTLMFREGSPADVAYLVSRGQVSIEVHSPNRGPVTVDTIPAGHMVGLSWAAPPYRYQFDARAESDVEAVALDAVSLRAALAENPAAATVFSDRLASVLLARLQAARLRLLDVYGPRSV